MNFSTVRRHSLTKCCNAVVNPFSFVLYFCVAFGELLFQCFAPRSIRAWNVFVFLRGSNRAVSRLRTAAPFSLIKDCTKLSLQAPLLAPPRPPVLGGDHRRSLMFVGRPVTRRRSRPVSGPCILSKSIFFGNSELNCS